MSDSEKHTPGSSKWHLAIARELKEELAREPSIEKKGYLADLAEIHTSIGKQMKKDEKGDKGATPD